MQGLAPAASDDCDDYLPGPLKFKSLAPFPVLLIDCGDDACSWRAHGRRRESDEGRAMAADSIRKLMLNDQVVKIRGGLLPFGLRWLRCCSAPDRVNAVSRAVAKARRSQRMMRLAQPR